MPPVTMITPALGFLEGHANIGPLIPVQRPDQPSPTPSPEVCTSYGLAIYASDGKTEVTSFNLQPDCRYRVQLASGTYSVMLGPRQGIGGSKDLPKTVAIKSGETSQLDFSIDTGIR